MFTYLDSTLLKPNAIIEEITKLCNDASYYHFPCVIVSPYYIPLAKDILEDTTVSVGTVIGFPLGFSTKEVKVYEAIDALEKGADEIDMVINIGALKDHEYEYVKQEIEEIRDVMNGKTLKVIIETCYLTKEEIIKMTEICNETFVNFIKTSTGFGDKGATIEDIDIIHQHKNEVLEIKASGGINTIEDANLFLEHGVTRIGTSHAKEIMGGELK